MPEVRVGAFGLLDSLSVGGMAEVYLAHPAGSRDPSEVFAIKWARPEVAQDRQMHLSLVDESRIARTLDHPNICRVHGYGEELGRVFVVMEFIHGKDLRSVQKRAPEVGKPVPYWVSAYIVSCVCDALDYAHRRTDKEGEDLDIVHRDLNPHNVMITYDGVPKLIDFGIAKAAGKSVETHVGAVKGKSAYMAPEQARGLQLDSRTDIYAAGLLLYELATGRRALQGKDDESILIAAGDADHKPPTDVNPDLPHALVDIVEKALQFNPRHRYQQAWEMADALRVYLKGEAPVNARQTLASFMDVFFRQERLEEEARIKKLIMAA